VKIGKCGNVKMWKCGNVEMWKCENVKIKMSFALNWKNGIEELSVRS
jgi:hypothetical protein